MATYHNCAMVYHKYDQIHMIVDGVLGVVWRLFGACLEGVWRVSGGFRKVSVGCLVGVWGCLRDVWRFS